MCLPFCLPPWDEPLPEASTLTLNFHAFKSMRSQFLLFIDHPPVVLCYNRIATQNRPRHTSTNVRGRRQRAKRGSGRDERSTAQDLKGSLQEECNEMEAADAREILVKRGSHSTTGWAKRQVQWTEKGSRPVCLENRRVYWRWNSSWKHTEGVKMCSSLGILRIRV